MKIVILSLLIAFLSGQENSGPFKIDIRSTFVNEDSKITVQFMNESSRTVSFMEGFVNVRNSEGFLQKEMRLTIVKNDEPALPHGYIRSKSVRFNNKSEEFFLLDFQISRLKFSEDHRYYTWHPSVGFIRID